MATTQQKDRKRRALDRLEVQLRSGHKHEKKTNQRVPLTDSDKKRIEKEIGILQTRV